MSRLSLQKQLLISMVLLIAVPLLFMTAFGNYYYAKAIDEQANEYSTQMLDQVRTNIDASVRTVDRMMEYLFRNEDVIAYLRLGSFYDPQRIALETAARMQMRMYMDINPELLGGLLIAGENGLYASNELYRVTSDPLNEDGWYRRAVEAGGERVLISRPIGRNIRNYRNYSANDIVSVVRAVHDPDSGVLLGVICADMRTDVIEERIRDVTLGKSGYVFVQDGSGEIVYAPVNETVYRIRPEWVSAAPGIHTIGGERYQLLLAHSEITGWGTVGVFRMGEPLQPVLALRKYTIAVAVVAILLATAMSLSFSASFTGPISKLRRLMGEAERGNLDVEFDAERYTGEIHQLGGSFNSMMDNIRDLLNLVYREQQEKREAEEAARQEKRDKRRLPKPKVVRNMNTDEFIANMGGGNGVNPRKPEAEEPQEAAEERPQKPQRRERPPKQERAPREKGEAKRTEVAAEAVRVEADSDGQEKIEIGVTEVVLSAQVADDGNREEDASAMDDVILTEELQDTLDMGE